MLLRPRDAARFLADILLVCHIILGLSNATVKTICVSEESNLSNTDCTEVRPLAWFVNGSTDIPEHTTLLFLPGEHTLNSLLGHNAMVVFSNKNSLKLTAVRDQGSYASPRVICIGNQSGFLFTNCTGVTVEYIQFQGCTTDMHINGCENQHPKPFYGRGAVFFHCSHHIIFEYVTIRESQAFGIYMDNVCGNITINNTRFIANKGNAVSWFRHCQNSNLSNTTTLFVDSSEFADGYNFSRANATGLYLIILQPQTQVTLTNITVGNNTGESGGNIFIRFVDYARHLGFVHISDSKIQDGVAHKSGGGMNIWFEKNNTENNDLGDCSQGKSLKPVITIVNTEFHGNKAQEGGGGLLVTYTERPGVGCTIRQVELQNCTLTNNTAPKGSALGISKHQLPIYRTHNVPQFAVILCNGYVINNALTPKKGQYNEDGIVEIFSVEYLIIENTTFSMNNGTALMLVKSGVKFERNVLFKQNSARYGGAIRICDSSQMYFTNDTRVKFINNSADLAGGAIYAGIQCLQETPPCFFQIVNSSVIADIAEGILHFDGNHAGIAGHAIYGGSVDNCFTDIKLRSNSTSDLSYYNSFNLYKRMFEFSNDDIPSQVTSDPYGVCICKNQTNETMCEQRVLYFENLYPGQHFPIYISAVGQTNDTVPAHLNIKAHNPNITANLITNPSINESVALCREILIQVFVGEENIDTNITLNVGVFRANLVSESSNYYRIPKLVINATIRSCPFLFQLSQRNSCDCPKQINGSYYTKCDIDTEMVTINRTKNPDKPDSIIWISCDYNHTTNSCDTIAGSLNCQTGHCNSALPTPVLLNKDNLSMICSEGREGRLCGKCCLNYTLSIGPFVCIETETHCHMWSTLLLLMGFIIAGVLLVFFIAALNFTVAEGTVHGLLFYANCIHLNQVSFSNTGPPPKLFMFISWLNLDFGFQVCFYSGMTAYQKIWLEFGFLFYLVLLGVLIVCLSRRFVWFTRLVGRNVVPVLATVILFAYPKLVRNCIRVWECHANYWSSDSNTSLVWYLDETIECFVGKHLALFIVSVVLFAVALWYTLCLLLIQCLQRRSNWFVLRWVNKLRPFFDANTGPYHNNHRFWPGFLLAARVGIYVVFWQIDSKIIQSKSITIAAICVLFFLLACFFPRGVYKKWSLNLLEYSFILNLGLASVIVAYHSGHSYIIGYISSSIATFTFILIVIYHSYNKIQETQKWQRFVRHTSEMLRVRQQHRDNNDTENVQEENTPLIQQPQGMPQIIDFNAPREPLLEDD